MVRYTQLYWLFLIQRLKILMEYRLNFFIGSISTVAVQGALLATVFVVMSQVPNLNGWTLYEILLIYGFITLAKSINHMFADNLWTLGRQYIRNGMFDRFLVRPVNPLFHLLADRFCHDGIGNFLVGVVLVVNSWHVLGIPLTLLNVFYAMVMVISGGFIFIAINLATCVVSFWVMDNVAFTRSFFETHLFAQYPLSIYPRVVNIILTWFIPYGLASYYPASFLLGRDVGILAWLPPLVAFIMMLLAYRIWLFGLSHYSGTGS
jgi:ABC-2 type transport system permease protein